MRKLRILLAEVVGLGLFLAWLMWKYPELVDNIIPWIALLIAWHFTYEFVLDTKLCRAGAVTLGRKVNRVLIWFIVFLLGGGISLLYWIGINKSLGRLASFAAQKAALKQAEKQQAQTPSDKSKPSSEQVPSTSAAPPTQPPIRHAIAPQVTLHTHLQPSPYPNGFVFAGIVWDEGYSDVRLDISVGKAPIHDLDFLVQLDTTIMGVGQITQFPGCTQFPPTGNISAFTLLGTDEKGKNVALPVEPTPGNVFGAPIYRVHCNEVFANVTVRFAIATRPINPNKADGSLPDHLFAAKRDPQGITVEGTYKAAGITYPLKYSAKLEKVPK